MKMNYIYEEWRQVKGYEGLYEISSFGRVKSLNYHQTGKEGILLPRKDKDGYFYINLYKDKKRTTKKVHRLVAEAFIPNPENLPCINHKGENPSKNFVWQLEWCSVKYNCNFGTRNNRMINTRDINQSYNHRKPVLQYDLQGNLINEFSSIIEVKKQLGYNAGNICQCCKGKLKQIYGYKWKYKKAV